jgi:hypothetical protein
MVLFPLLVAAQPPDTLWTRTYGGADIDHGYCVKQTTDGGYIISGVTYSFGSIDGDVYLIKTDAIGNLMWQNTIDGSDHDNGWSVEQTIDGGFIIAGDCEIDYPNYDIRLIKTDALGNLTWQKWFGNYGFDRGFCVQQTQDSGYIICGESQNLFGIFYQLCLIKTDANGDTIWMRGFGGNNYDSGNSVEQTSDGGYIITGYSGPLGSSDILLVKTDINGNLIWQRKFDGNYNDVGYSVHQTDDGGYIIAGKTRSTAEYDVWLIKTDNDGNLIWQRTFGGNQDDIAYSIQQTTDRGYIISGYTLSFGAGGQNVYLIKTDSLGDLTWQCVFNPGGSDDGRSVMQTTDGGYVITGSSGSDVCLIKTVGTLANISIDLIPFTLPIQIPASGGSFSFYVSANNQDTTNADVTLWTRQILPNGTLTPPLLGPFTVNLPPGTRAWFRNQNVPGSAPSGQYKYIGYAGIYPNTVWSSDTLIYSKLTTGSGPVIGDWANTGDSFSGEESPPLIRGDGGDLIAASPNPFNPTTTISFKLQAASYVNLNVYDTAGRLVSTLVEGMQESGTHEVTFDGSQLTSGIYLTRLEVVSSGSGTTPTTLVQKMVLLK